MCPGIGRVHCNIDGNVTDDFDVVCICIVLQLPVLLEKFELQIHLKLDLEIQLPAVVVQGITPAKSDILRPLIPALSSKEILQCHKQSIIIQPPAIFFHEFLVCGILADIASLVCHGQKNISIFVLCLIIDIILIITKISRITFLVGQNTFIDQCFQIDKIGIAGKGGKRLIGRIAIAGRMNR